MLTCFLDSPHINNETINNVVDTLHSYIVKVDVINDDYKYPHSGKLLQVKRT